jgi:hypothetical protein
MISGNEVMFKAHQHYNIIAMTDKRERLSASTKGLK